jgi:hypothetical protein
MHTARPHEYGAANGKLHYVDRYQQKKTVAVDWPL